jgi:hypothetical protein
MLLAALQLLRAYHALHDDMAGIEALTGKFAALPTQVARATLAVFNKGQRSIRSSWLFLRPSQSLPGWSCTGIAANQAPVGMLCKRLDPSQLEPALVALCRAMCTLMVRFNNVAEAMEAFYIGLSDDIDEQDQRLAPSPEGLSPLAASAPATPQEVPATGAEPPPADRADSAEHRLRIASLGALSEAR